MRSNRNAASVPERNSTESSAQLGGTLARIIPAFKLFPQRLGAGAMATEVIRRSHNLSTRTIHGQAATRSADRILCGEPR
jgi:hypothetical protein